MRRPIWQLTGLLSIGLAGCLRGQDWRAVVSKPTIYPVAERRQSLPTPKVIGPFRDAPSKLASPAASTVLQASATTAPSPKSDEPPGGESFAEFERTIPPRMIETVNRRKPQTVEPSVADVAEVIVPEVTEPKKSVTLPVITPGRAILSSNRAELESASPSGNPAQDDSEANDLPRALFPKSAVLAKELPAVNDATATPATASPSAEAERPVRPQEVSVLVQQVFDDLRQRRLSDARKRTEWLKQLVAKRTPASSLPVTAEESKPETFEHKLDEPRTLIVDPQASPLEKSKIHSAPVQNEPTSHQ